MSIDLKRIELVLIGMMAPESREQMSSLFRAFETDKLTAFTKGMNTFNWMTIPDEKGNFPVDTGSACFMSFAAGVFMAEMSQHPEYHAGLFDYFIEQRSKENGENVVDFVMEKARKR